MRKVGFGETLKTFRRIFLSLVLKVKRVFFFLNSNYELVSNTRSLWEPQVNLLSESKVLCWEN